MYRRGSFVIQGLLQHYGNWKHLGEQLVSIGLAGIYLQPWGRKIHYHNSKKPHYSCHVTVYLDFKGTVDVTSGSSLFTDARAHLVTKWILQRGTMGSYLACGRVAIECEKSNGDGRHYWEVHADLPVDNYRGLKYAFRSVAGDGDAMLCAYAIETEKYRKAGFKDEENTRFPTYKPLPPARPLLDELFQVFEFGYDSQRPLVKREVSSVPEDAEILITSQPDAGRGGRGAKTSFRVSMVFQKITKRVAGEKKKQYAESETRTIGLLQPEYNRHDKLALGLREL